MKVKFFTKMICQNKEMMVTSNCLRRESSKCVSKEVKCITVY